MPNVAHIRRPTSVQIAWAAGLFDGEGCISITFQQPGSGGRVNPSYRLYTKVAMGHEPTIFRLRDLFGIGAITLQHSNKGHNDAWIWWAASRQAVEFIELIRPYLVTKAYEADLAVEFGNIPLSPRGGNGGGKPVPPRVLSERRRLFELMRDAKPSARFRAAKAKAAIDALEGAND